MSTLQIRELSILGSWELTPQPFADDRGVFLEYLRSDELTEAIGHPFHVAQGNCSVSKAGTLRGIHYADVPPSQAKYVTCTRGAVLDVVVDIRVGSPTFGQWDSVLLDDVDRKAIYISEGLGHVFLALDDDSTVLYLCSAPYAPTREHGIHPLDAAIGIQWPTLDRQGRELTPLLSPKDEQAPSLEEVKNAGALPDYEQTQAFISSMK